MHNLLKVLLLGTMLMPAMGVFEAYGQGATEGSIVTETGAPNPAGVIYKNGGSITSAPEAPITTATSGSDSTISQVFTYDNGTTTVYADGSRLHEWTDGSVTLVGKDGKVVDGFNFGEGSTTPQAVDGAGNWTLNSDGTWSHTGELSDATDPEAVLGQEMSLEESGALDPNAPTTVSDGEITEVPTIGEDGKVVEGSSPAAAKANVGEKTVSWNVGQYILVIMEALKDQEIDDATKEVTVKGAEQMQQSQGSPSSGASTSTTATDDTGTPMSATTIGGAASALRQLLEKGKIDLSLLSEEFEESEATTSSGALGLGRVASQSGSVEDFSQSSTDNSSQTENTSNGLTTAQQRELNRRRNLLLAEWAVAATQIGEGSNAISAAFYERASGFSSAASAAQGSLGGISTITDTDRFVLFELTRAAALSAIQLGLQGAVNLNDIGLPESSSSPSDSSSGTGALGLGNVSSQ